MRSTVAYRELVLLVEETILMIRFSQWGSFATTILLERDFFSSSSD
jgi:hypothetical protein